MSNTADGPNRPRVVGFFAGLWQKANVAYEEFRKLFLLTAVTCASAAVLGTLALVVSGHLRLDGIDVNLNEGTVRVKMAEDGSSDGKKAAPLPPPPPPPVEVPGPAVAPVTVVKAAPVEAGPRPPAVPADLVLLFDRSYPPVLDQQEALFQEVQGWAKTLLNRLDDRHRVSLLAVNGHLVWSARDVELGSGRGVLQKKVDALFPDGACALTDGTLEAVNHLQTGYAKGPAAVVIFTVAHSDKSAPDAAANLRAQLAAGSGLRPVQVYAVIYGQGPLPSDDAPVVRSLRELTTPSRFFAAHPGAIGGALDGVLRQLADLTDPGSPTPGGH
jgi:hypothetical protein